MTRHAHLDPSPFFLEGGPTGILLIHGYTGAPPEMRLVGDYLHARGLTVAGPLLPGHGTTVHDLNRCRWSDWAGHVERALANLRDRCRAVFVGGLSLGSLLALNLAVQHPDLSGVIAYSPATWPADWRIYLTPVARYFMRTQPKSGEPDYADPETDLRLWCYEEDGVPAAYQVLKLALRVRRSLPRLSCPLLVIHSTGDRSIHPTSAQRTYERAGSREKELVTLHHSGHCITVDQEWETVAQASYQFILSHSG